ncbi:MAG: MYXO-CTERM sorting domain-containing protein [Deltaproteobacteria bacterium]|nr:MYXO-CTERM sorting domain-containing protein [Deltaproteobacteria bacterium]
MSVRRSLCVGPLLFALIPAAQAAESPTGYHPWAHDHVKPLEIDARDLIAHPERYRQQPIDQPDFHALDDSKAPVGSYAQPDPSKAGHTPDGWQQRGNVVLPSPVAAGDLEVDPGVAHGMAVIPGNEYPRKHTLFLNFNGGMLYSGSDNSAENKSTLARQAVYPTYEGGEQKALSIIQAVEEDVANYGIIVTYAERPNPTVPYTMQMMGGQWTDTNIDSPAGGVAPGADCGALGQRHVVYTFASGGTSATQAANTASQEAGHAWGLDHTFNCDSVMSYCGVSNGGFSNECDGLCETQCQGPNSAGCRLTHEEYCGEGNDQQNEDAELAWIFGGNEPDMEPPEVTILEPEDGLELEAGADIRVRTLVSDNYGGYGWYYVITRNGEEMANFVDFDRQVDEDYRAALNLGGLEDGEWVITVGAEDQFGHITEDTVTVVVGDPSAAVDDTGEPPMGTTGDDDPTEGTGSADGGVADDGTTGRGCGCRAQGSTGGTGLWGLLLLGGFVLRRRRR